MSRVRLNLCGHGTVLKGVKMKAGVGSSILADARAAGKEAAQKAAAGLPDLRMAYVYASCDYDVEAMLAGVKEALPGIPLIGNTSFTGVITPEGFISGPDGFVGVMAVSDPEMAVGIASVTNSGDPQADGRKAAELAIQKAGKTGAPDYFYMAAPPGAEEYFLKGITEIIGRAPFFGGSAADNTIEGNWKLWTDAGTFADGVAVAFFYTDKKMTNKYTGAYHETGDMGIITKVINDRTLAEIDGTPALQKYADWRGLSTDELMGGALLAASIISPLGVKDRLGDLVAIRHPMNGNDDLTLNVGNKLSTGTAIIRMECTVDELIASTGETLAALKEKAGGSIAAFHLVHCGGRRAGIDARIGEAAAAIRKEAGDIPFLCEFTFGEYGFEQDGCNTCGGLMLSFTAFAE
ncbi:MAG: FIST N-terminal domain-containing protein [Eubacteriales bacterium]|nr:FIST N-terminal domain-containing protein [Eubacteriales bacterium]